MEKMEKRLSMKEKWLNLNDYKDFIFTLNDRKAVNHLELAGLVYGGATKYGDGKIYTNFENGSKVLISTNTEFDNTLSIYIPSTLGGEKAPQPLVDTVLYKVVNKIAEDGYSCKERMNLENAIGVWRDDENKKLVTEGIIIVSLSLKTIANSDVYNFIAYGKYIKKAMRQEAVAIGLNKAIAMV